MKLLLPALSVVLFAFACEGTLIAPLDCGEIPNGGCIDKGNAVDQCADRTCSTLYTCAANDPAATVGTWQQQRECPVRPAEPELDAGPVDAASDASVDEGGSLPPNLPAGAYGGPGCISLQVPDCALAVGYACQTACCGCEELFVCESGEWFTWGTCVDDVPTPH